jgi:hypothetical protein
MAYWIGNTLADFPVASLVVACASSGIILGIAYVVWRKMRRTPTESAVAQP